METSDKIQKVGPAHYLVSEKSKHHQVLGNMLASLHSGLQQVNLNLAGTRHFANGTRGGATPFLCVSKVCVVELSGKYQRIALDEFSRLAVRFLP